MIITQQHAQPIPASGRLDGSVRVVIADDHQLTRRTVERVLSSHPRIEVVGVASNGAEARDLAQELKPDVILLDVQMPVMGGFEAARDIVSNPAIRIVFMSSHAESAYRAAASEFSAQFVDKSAPEQDLVSAILNE